MSAPPAPARAPLPASGCGGEPAGAASLPDELQPFEVEPSCAVESPAAALDGVAVSAGEGAVLWFRVKDLPLRVVPAKQGSLARVTVMEPVRFEGGAPVGSYGVKRPFDAASGMLHVEPGARVYDLVPRGGTARATLSLGSDGPSIEDMSVACDALTVPGSQWKEPRVVAPADPWVFQSPPPGAQAPDQEADGLLRFWTGPGEGEELKVHSYAEGFAKTAEQGAFVRLSLRMDNGSTLSGWVKKERAPGNLWGDAIGDMFAPCGEGLSGIDSEDVAGRALVPVGAKISAGPGWPPWGTVTKELRVEATLHRRSGSVELHSIPGLEGGRGGELRHAFVLAAQVTFQPAAPR